MSSSHIVNCVCSLQSDMPRWLDQSSEKLTFSSRNLRHFLNSRSLFYGGAGWDGAPLRLFARSHAIHCFLYVDYSEQWFSPNFISATIVPPHDRLDETWSPAFHGYWPICNEIISPQDFINVAGKGLWTDTEDQRSQRLACLPKVESLVTEPSRFDTGTLDLGEASFEMAIRRLLRNRPIVEDDMDEDYYWWGFNQWPGPSFIGAVWAILERDARLGESHGPKRFAFLHMTADAFWSYWLLYGRTRIAPFAIVVHDHGYGGNHSDFGGFKSALLALTQLTGLPPWLLRGRYTRRWPGYRMIPGHTAPNFTSGVTRVLERKVSDLIWRRGRYG